MIMSDMSIFSHDFVCSIVKALHEESFHNYLMHFCISSVLGLRALMVCYYLTHYVVRLTIIAKLPVRQCYILIGPFFPVPGSKELQTSKQWFSKEFF